MMNFLEKMSISTFAASTLLLLSFSAFSAGIDDITNYQSPPPQVEEKTVQPYTIQDIINKLPSLIDDDGVYIGRVGGRGSEVDLTHDPRMHAFDEEKFERCNDLYIGDYGSRGGSIFDSTLYFLFPRKGEHGSSQEEYKAMSGRSLKSDLKYIEDTRNYHYGDKRCEDRAKYVAQIKEIVDAIIKAAPTILPEKQRLAEASRTAALKSQKEAQERANAEQQTREKAAADRRAMELAESKGREERANKLKACQATNEYKLYEISATIEYNQAIARNAALEIQRQKEAAKISGYIDKPVMIEMGNRVAGANRLNKENFEAYRKLGGSARNLEAVKTLPNPCPQ
jgi:hypothetical protein